MSLKMLEELYAEKRVVEKENEEMEAKLEKKADGHGTSADEDFKQRMEEMERERKNSLINQNNFDKEVVENLNEALAEEEKNAKDMLDLKVKQTNELTLQRENCREVHEKYQKNRGDIIELQDNKSTLEERKGKLEVETGKLQKENEEYDKKNEELKINNEELEAQIEMAMKRIQVNHLLKEIDIEELRQVAINNTLVNKTILQMTKEWDHIQET